MKKATVQQGANNKVGDKVGIQRSCNRWLMLTETELQSLAGDFAAMLADRECHHPALVFFLQGELGAGKTTFVRALLQSLGIRERIKSPTYSLVETYQAEYGIVQHFDFYRVKSVDELEFIALRELLDTASLVLVEWPEIALAELPAPNWELTLEHQGSQRRALLSEISAAAPPATPPVN